TQEWSLPTSLRRWVGCLGRPPASSCCRSNRLRLGSSWLDLGLACSNFSMLKLKGQARISAQCMLKFRMLNMCVMERHERIARAIQLSGKKKGEIATECGVKPSAVTQWVDGSVKSMKPENLFALA